MNERQRGWDVTLFRRRMRAASVEPVCALQPLTTVMCPLKFRFMTAQILSAARHATNPAPYVAAVNWLANWRIRSRFAQHEP